ncbi:DUF3046 domain-containing protein [Microbacterium sp. M3]|uniref:DUF3046 domain-containing protein n=1 Tax=Microbacterium arthrosphaerae TaxID=792652 RepID=A0ABU4H189_9MICO|nr:MULTISPECIES: DUF3046 domain-containing protein [Microbacterium]MDW4573100.1 DUF3046 domain-containing protein [Microbacterium arthrosphaerae]MDW7606955.1 DUF3046 domain-containing protein [Microbacterium sp. M3]
MRRSEFNRAVNDEFGGRAGTVVTDLVLSQVGGRTAADAIAAGVDPREVWLAICEELDVPAERRYGVGRLEPRRR